VSSDPRYPVMRLLMLLEDFNARWTPEVHRTLMQNGTWTSGVTNKDFLAAANADLARAAKDRQFAKELIEICNGLEQDMPEKREMIGVLRNQLKQFARGRTTPTGATHSNRRDKPKSA